MSKEITDKEYWEMIEQYCKDSGYGSFGKNIWGKSGGALQWQIICGFIKHLTQPQPTVSDEWLNGLENEIFSIYNNWIIGTNEDDAYAKNQIVELLRDKLQQPQDDSELIEFQHFIFRNQYFYNEENDCFDYIVDDHQELECPQNEYGSYTFKEVLTQFREHQQNNKG